MMDRWIQKFVSLEYDPGIDPALATRPVATDHTELSFCRAMQRWAAREVNPRNNQRAICISDWFSEELLITRTTHPNPADSPNSNTEQK